MTKQMLLIYLLFLLAIFIVTAYFYVEYNDEFFRNGLLTPYIQSLGGK